MAERGFFCSNGFGIPIERVFFESTRAAKLERICALGCTHFIDDLEEVFSDPAFPARVLPILFAATSPEALPGGYYGPGGLGELRGSPARALIMPQARDAATGAKLWEVSEKLTGASFE